MAQFLCFCFFILCKIAPHCRQTVHFQFPSYFVCVIFDLKFIHVLFFCNIFFMMTTIFKFTFNQRIILDSSWYPLIFPPRLPICILYMGVVMSLLYLNYQKDNHKDSWLYLCNRFLLPSLVTRSERAITRIFISLGDQQCTVCEPCSWDCMEGAGCAQSWI